MGDSSDRLQRDPQKEAGQNEAQRNFRRQFGLDRPVLLNTWIWIDEKDLREKIARDAAPIGQPGDAEAKRKAKEALEDYGPYAVTGLIELLRTTTGGEQDNVLYWLLRASQRVIIRGSAPPTREDLSRWAEWSRENSTIKQWKWARGAPAEVREPVVAKWTQWYERNRERWDYSGARGVKRLLTDTQFGTYWGHLVRGDLGNSHIYKQPVIGLVLDRMKYSLALNLTALVIAYLLAVPLGIYGAWKQGTLAERALGIALFALYSLPNFFVGTLLLKWFATGEPYAWFPIAGFEGENTQQLDTFRHLGDILWHITLPLVCLTYGGLASLSRFARTGMLDVIRSDYVRTARAKGLSEWTVILKHVVRNGILPIITLLGTALPVLIGGSVAIEYIFNINGMGLLMINSIYQKDFNVVMGVQLIVGVLTMVGILLSDVAYALLDPRISLS